MAAGGGCRGIAGDDDSRRVGECEVRAVHEEDGGSDAGFEDFNGVRDGTAGGGGVHGEDHWRVGEKRPPHETGKTYSKIRRGRGDGSGEANSNPSQVEANDPSLDPLRIVRGLLLKGNGLADVAPELWPLVLFAAIMLTIGIKRYRQTLD